jgi:hemerythrin superfamily protein
MKAISSSTLLLFCLGLFISMSSMVCAPRYDALGLQNATNLSSKTLELMGKATEPFTKNATAVTTLFGEITDAHTRATKVKKNTEIANSWKTLKDEILTPYFDNWKAKGKLDKDFVKESMKQVTASFDAIKNAEEAKRKKKKS